MTSVSSTVSSTRDRAHTRSPWPIVTVLLDSARPLCMRSTVMSNGWSGTAPRAKTVCSVLTDLPSCPCSAATTVCASN